VTDSRVAGPALRVVERVGRGSLRGVEELGIAGSLLWDCVYWVALGRLRKQPVRLRAIAAEMWEIGIRALPIVTVLSATIGMMLAIQGIYTLSTFGAESQVVVGIALSVVREFSPLVTGILVTGRSGSALAARLATMTISQEVDALRVLGIDPVRYLAAPSLVAMVVMVPCLVLFSDALSLLGGGLYVAGALGMSLSAYTDRVIEALAVGDLLHGLGKSLVFAVLICVVGVLNGATVRGGAEGVGRVTTRSVVHGISAIVVADMLFAFATTRSGAP
jgi:phospholipid/cholesterol/gamma-HCH transport system permease protein